MLELAALNFIHSCHCRNQPSKPSLPSLHRKNIFPHKLLRKLQLESQWSSVQLRQDIPALVLKPSCNEDQHVTWFPDCWLHLNVWKQCVQWPPDHLVVPIFVISKQNGGTFTFITVNNGSYNSTNVMYSIQI